MAGCWSCCDRGSRSRCGIPGARGDGEPAAGGCRLVTPPSGAPIGPSSGVMVVEQGYTRIPSSGTVVSMGAVLQNTIDKVAYRTSPDLAISTLRSIPETADLNKTE